MSVFNKDAAYAEKMIPFYCKILVSDDFNDGSSGTPGVAMQCNCTIAWIVATLNIHCQYKRLTTITAARWGRLDSSNRFTWPQWDWMNFCLTTSCSKTRSKIFFETPQLDASPYVIKRIDSQDSTRRNSKTWVLGYVLRTLLFWLSRIPSTLQF